MNKVELWMANTQELLDQIGQIESARGYDYAFGNKPIPLSEMTIGEAMKWQDDLRNSPDFDHRKNSTAIGRYQFMRDTMRDLTSRNPNDLPLDKMMTPEVQDQMATILLDRRGLKKYQSGEMDETEFARNLSKEWASLPNPDTGHSYYDKDGLNKSLIEVDTIMGKIRSAKPVLMTPEEQRMYAEQLRR